MRPQLFQAAYLIRQIYREFIDDRCTREANAMAYRTLFSSVPILAVFLSVFTMFDVFEAFQDKILSVAYSLFVPTAGDIIRDNMLQFAQNTKTLGTLGFVGTIIAALYLFWATERSFNDIWHIERERSFVRKFTAFTAMLLWTPILLGLSFYLTGKLHSRVPNILGEMELTVPGWITLRFLPVIFSFFALTIIYIVVPNTRVSVRAAALGGMVAAAGWEVVKLGFNFYVVRAVSYSKVYGSLAVVPIFIIGLFLLWIVVFLGLEFTYVLHNYQYHETWDKHEWSGMKPYLAAALMIEIGRRFYENEPAPDVRELSRLFRVAIPTLNEVFNNLLKRRLVVEIDDDIFMAAKSLKFISLKEVVAAGVGEINAIERMAGNFRSLIKGLPDEIVSELEKTFFNVSNKCQDMLSGVTMDDILSKRQNN